MQENNTNPIVTLDQQVAALTKKVETLTNVLCQAKEIFTLEEAAVFLGVLNFTASLMGKGKLGEANKRNATLEAENARLKQEATDAKEQAKADKEAYRKKLNGQFSQAVKKEVHEATNHSKPRLPTLNGKT